MGHNTHNFNQYHHINYNNHPSDCDLNSKLKDLKEESSQHSFSNIEVIEFTDYFAISLLYFHVYSVYGIPNEFVTISAVSALN